MSCEMAVLPFQAHANYGTWSIDFLGSNIGGKNGQFNITKITSHF